MDTFVQLGTSDMVSLCLSFLISYAKPHTVNEIINLNTKKINMTLKKYVKRQEQLKMQPVI